MSFLTAEKRTTFPVAPRGGGGGGEALFGEGPFKNVFFFIWTPFLKEAIIGMSNHTMSNHTFRKIFFQSDNAHTGDE